MPSPYLTLLQAITKELKARVKQAETLADNLRRDLYEKESLLKQEQQKELKEAQVKGNIEAPTLREAIHSCKRD